MTVRWEGAKEFAKFLEDTADATEKDVAAALFQEGEKIMAASKKDTPVDTGRLRSSGHVKDPKISRGGGVEVELAYATDYALAVHEIPRGYKSGKSKYLESNMKAAATGFGNRMIETIKKRLS